MFILVEMKSALAVGEWPSIIDITQYSDTTVLLICNQLCNGPYPPLCHKIKMAAIVRGLCTGSLWGGQCYTIRNPKTFQVRHIYNHLILIRQE